ncbi:hypothetical protein K466DRAFT_250062 [Polyporus arcularius HHB13444]|uniref:non-specific serine/threonine protein kinase n=1 Tax=Polyporus arcularius HHB13444 TaxID=1314778 RepID=A0A5C3P284_9APHY|nr:hypothetical protein K466DRAFT_250062 [Polyporus arcularius HHB13444]
MASIQLGDQLDHGRYEIVCTLGYRTASNVWLARDMTTVVLSRSTRHPGREHVVEAERFFITDSKYGSHIRFVNRPFAVSLYPFMRIWPRRVMPLHGAKFVIKQLLLALDYLLSLGYVHADVKTDNLLLHFEENDDDIESYLKKFPSENHPPQHVSEIFKGPHHPHVRTATTT